MSDTPILPPPQALGPCAKRRVRCTVVMNHHGGAAVVGENLCRNPQPVCPRAEGEDYTKCRTICQQIGHAEEVAAMKIKLLGWTEHGGTAFLQGHHYACGDCRRKLAQVGVFELFVGQHWLLPDGTPVPKPDSTEAA